MIGKNIYLEYRVLRAHQDRLALSFSLYAVYIPYYSQRKQQAVQEPDLRRPVFRIMPDKFVLEPYETCVITLEGSTNE